MGLPSWLCSSFDLLYRSITDFMLKKSLKIKFDQIGALLAVYKFNSTANKNKIQFNRRTSDILNCALLAIRIVVDCI